jgi:hypothetical protein
MNKLDTLVLVVGMCCERSRIEEGQMKQNNVVRNCAKSHIEQFQIQEVDLG